MLPHQAVLQPDIIVTAPLTLVLLQQALQQKVLIQIALPAIVPVGQAEAEEQPALRQTQILILNVKIVPVLLLILVRQIAEDAHLPEEAAAQQAEAEEQLLYPVMPPNSAV